MFGFFKPSNDAVQIPTTQPDNTSQPSVSENTLPPESIQQAQALNNPAAPESGFLTRLIQQILPSKPEANIDDLVAEFVHLLEEDNLEERMTQFAEERGDEGLQALTVLLEKIKTDLRTKLPPVPPSAPPPPPPMPAPKAPSSTPVKRKATLAPNPTDSAKDNCIQLLNDLKQALKDRKNRQATDSPREGIQKAPKDDLTQILRQALDQRRQYLENNPKPPGDDDAPSDEWSCTLT